MNTTFSQQYLIALGSNLGDRAAYLAQAKAHVAARIGPVVQMSSTYETQPIGEADQLFFNAALVVSTTMTPLEVLAELLAIETAMGRVRVGRWGNRTIDLDLLLWRRGNQPDQNVTSKFEADSLRIPHPAMLDRAFVLIPAAEIVPEWIHPDTGCTVVQERNRLENTLASPLHHGTQSS